MYEIFFIFLIKLNIFKVKYLVLPGWKTNICEIRHFNDLPDNAKKFVTTISDLLDIPGN